MVKFIDDMKKQIELKDRHGTTHSFGVGNSFNKGKLGTGNLIANSIAQLGCGRSVLVDAENNVLSGEKTLMATAEQGKGVILIETDGDDIVVVKRIDVKRDSKKGLNLSLVDNLIASKTLDWNTGRIRQLTCENISFDPRHWYGHECLIEELNLEDFFEKDNNIKKNIKTKELVCGDILTLFD